MQKVILICAIAALTTTSCKKNHTCECISEGGGMTTTASFSVHDTKKNAKADCETTGSNGFSTTTCKLK